MPPRRRQPDPDAFETALAEYQGVAGTLPVDNDALITGLDKLETVAMQELGSQPTKKERIAQAMHEVFSKIADVTVEPPLDEEQSKFVAGKVAIYGMMREVVEPKDNRPAKKTDTSKVVTDQRKS